MITLKSDEEKLISFDMNIQNSSKLPSIRLVIENINSDFDITIPATFEQGIVEAKIPKMDGLINEFSGKKRLKARVEAIIEDTYFIPWESDIIVEPTVKVLAKQKEIKEADTKPKIKTVLKEIKEVKKEVEKIEIKDGIELPVSGPPVFQEISEDDPFNEALEKLDLVDITPVKGKELTKTKSRKKKQPTKKTISEEFEDFLES